MSVFRSVVRIRELMASNFTIEQIQNEFFFIRSDIEQLDSTLESIFSTLREVLKEKEKNGVRHVVARDVKEAKALSVELSERLLRIEDQISSQAPVSVVKVS